MAEAFTSGTIIGHVVARRSGAHHRHINEWHHVLHAGLNRTVHCRAHVAREVVSVRPRIRLLHGDRIKSPSPRWWARSGRVKRVADSTSAAPATDSTASRVRWSACRERSAFTKRGSWRVCRTTSATIASITTAARNVRRDESTSSSVDRIAKKLRVQRVMQPYLETVVM